MKVMTVVGARPQFIKAAVVSRAFRERCPGLREIIVHTGQHYDPNMSDVFFDELDIPRPDYNLAVGGGGHGQNTGRMLERLEVLMIEHRPDWVLVYGDTDSTLAGALAASKLHVPVAHVEAGLRSFNRRMPEEINRILTDHVADILFIPSETGRRNLRREGIEEEKIRFVGDVMYDAALFYKSRAKEPEWWPQLCLDKESYVLATVHRAENTDDFTRLNGIIEGLGQSGKSVIFPLHPRTKAKIEQWGISTPHNLYLQTPVSYLEMVWLENHASLIATDSGGVQKEAYFHGKPCVTLRDETEWVELVEAGWNFLVGARSNEITTAICREYSPCHQSLLYGEGDAAEGILRELSK